MQNDDSHKPSSSYHMRRIWCFCWTVVFLNRWFDFYCDTGCDSTIFHFSDDWAKPFRWPWVALSWHLNNEILMEEPRDFMWIDILWYRFCFCICFCFCFCFVNWSYRDSLELEQLSDRQWRLMQSTRWIASIEFVQLVGILRTHNLYTVYILRAISKRIVRVYFMSDVCIWHCVHPNQCFSLIKSTLRFVAIRYTSNLVLNWQWSRRMWNDDCLRLKTVRQSQFVKRFPIYFK